MSHVFDDNCINHNCDTCKYRDIDLPGLPCRDCLDGNDNCFWELGEETEEVPQ